MVTVIDLSEIDAGRTDLVGGKAAGLAELIRCGERVPAGFCLTTAAYQRGTVPRAEVAAAYDELGGGAVAVRSSATAEDLPTASFAGQQDTVLDVSGLDELTRAIERCWASAHSARAASYREANSIDDADVRMAVVVQRMIDPAVAGVLFTANPVTGRRTQMVIDAAPGLGTAVVDGQVVPDHYVVDPADAASAAGSGCLDAAQLRALCAAGQRVQEHFQAPQDIEWAIDHDGVLWLLQSRPITTLFPTPPPARAPGPRVYLELGGHFQGVVGPLTPMGNSVLRTVLGGLTGSKTKQDNENGGPPAPTGVVEIGGRLYADLTDMVRTKGADRWLPAMVGTDFGPRVRAVVEHVLADPRFAPLPGRRGSTRAALRTALRVAPRAVLGINRALARPAAARTRALDAVAAVERQTATDPAGLTAHQRLELVATSTLPMSKLEPLYWPLLAGILTATAPPLLLKSIATEAEVRTVLGGMPHNITTEMDLALWRIAAGATHHRELLADTPPETLAARYHAGTLPDIGLADFLARYGHRTTTEIDVGLPRWEEDPAPVFAALANYLRVDDPAQAPDRRFDQAAETAGAMLAELARRARRRPVRGGLAMFLLRRARSLAGLRELGKFAGLYLLRQTRRHLLAVGAELADRGALEHAEDVMFLDLGEVRAALDGVSGDLRAVVDERRAAYAREQRRRYVPIALLDDGTDVEALAPAPAAADGALVGLAAAPGTVTGRARVIHDPAGAHIEPGEVLVAPSTDPGWTPLFMTAGGLVTEVGAPIAHGPTVAREYGIPAVICVRDATRLITTGQLVTVDGAAGTVTVESGYS